MAHKPYQNARAKIKRARHHYDALAAEIKDFATAYPATIQVKIGEKPITPKLPHDKLPSFEGKFLVGEFMDMGGMQFQVEDPKVDIPDDLTLILGDCLHNLRSALDHCVRDAVLSLGKGTSGIKFPFAEDREKLEEIVRKDFAKAGDEICEMLMGLKPYKGGNTLLRGLHDLDIADKHKFLVPIDRESLYHLIKHTIYMGGKRMTVYRGETTIKKTLSRKHKIYGKHELPKDYDKICIQFSPKTAFSNSPVLAVLDDIFDMVEDIVSTFEQFTGGGNSVPSSYPAR